MRLEIQTILKDSVQRDEDKGVNWLLRVFNTGLELLPWATDMRQLTFVTNDPKMHNSFRGSLAHRAQFLLVRHGILCQSHPRKIKGIPSARGHMIKKTKLLRRL